MDPTEHTHPALGFDHPAYDSQAFNAFANLDAGGPFNTANGFIYDSLDSMLSFDECYAGIPVDGLDQSSPDNVPMLTAFNSGQPNLNVLSMQSPLNAFNQNFTNNPVNGAAQLSETASSNGSGQAVLSASAGFGKPSSTTPVNGTHQLSDTASSNDSGQAVLPAFTGFDKPSSTAPVNRSAQPATNNFPLHAPHRQVPYDPSIGIPYTPEDTDADKIRKWENLIAHTDLANAGVPASVSQIIEEESVGQSPQIVSSPNSLFDCPRSPSVEIVQTPSPTPLTPLTPSPCKPPAAIMAPSKPATNVTTRATPRAVQLPRALTNQKNYAQHVSPFAPVATVLPPAPSVPTSRELENARSRIQSLARERNYYQRSLRKATSIDPKSGKTSLQMLQTENAALRRVNAKQAQDLQELREQIKHQWAQYASLGDQYNGLSKQLHRTLIELKELKGE
ncbi:hypothetical protein N7463_010687 [Penicillium fimorum]|uniref:Uncharacterized protein n=1 Tax=Penicillium fimorum TaxID=1882269 RepID=A0A9W9XL99_9EURO|nr:hypothetical protein N7463_010687 [Penicillium fimorum]